MLIFVAISFIAATVSKTALPPSLASTELLMEIFSVCIALSVFWRMLEAISSIEEETSSALAACSVAPCDICWAVAESSWLPEATFSAAPWTSVTTSFSLATMLARDSINSSFSLRFFKSTIRLPLAINLALAVIALSASMFCLIETFIFSKLSAIAHVSSSLCATVVLTLRSPLAILSMFISRLTTSFD